MLFAVKLLPHRGPCGVLLSELVLGGERRSHLELDLMARGCPISIKPLGDKTMLSPSSRGEFFPFISSEEISKEDFPEVPSDSCLLGNA